jgi:hypothetical protein
LPWRLGVELVLNNKIARTEAHARLSADCARFLRAQCFQIRIVITSETILKLAFWRAAIPIYCVAIVTLGCDCQSIPTYLFALSLATYLEAKLTSLARVLRLASGTITSTRVASLDIIPCKSSLRASYTCLPIIVSIYADWCANIYSQYSFLGITIFAHTVPLRVFDLIGVLALWLAACERRHIFPSRHTVGSLRLAYSVFGCKPSGAWATACSICSVEQVSGAY